MNGSVHTGGTETKIRQILSGGSGHAPSTFGRPRGSVRIRVGGHIC